MWVFSGGGESEVKGLIPFLKRICSDHKYERKSPVRRKLGPRAPIEPGHGRTRKSLGQQIEKLLSESLVHGERCDLILIIDDLDCHDPNVRRALFHSSIGKVDNAADIETFVGFASPEIESWIIADWDHSIAADPGFRSRHLKMRHWLSTQRAVPFDRPETFGSFDEAKDSCCDKLSDAIIDSSLHCCARSRYSKSIHTARFLEQISPEIVSGKCPLFRELQIRLTSTD